MSSRVSNFSDLIQRVTASCLLHPLAAVRQDAGEISEDHAGDESEDDGYKTGEGERVGIGEWEDGVRTERVMEMEMMMGEVFEAVSAMKRAYVSLQEAHSPWDPDKMRVADVAVVAELRRLGVLRERFRRGCVNRRECSGRRKVGTAGATLREVVAPYEAAVEELKREVKVKEVEVENLREKLKTTTATSLRGSGGGGGKKGRSHQSKRKVSSSQAHQGILPSLHLYRHKMTKMHLPFFENFQVYYRQFKFYQTRKNKFHGPL